MWKNAFGLPILTRGWGWVLMAGMEASGQSKKLIAIKKQAVESELGKGPGCDLSKLTPLMPFH